MDTWLQFRLVPLHTQHLEQETLLSSGPQQSVVLPEGTAESWRRPCLPQLVCACCKCSMAQWKLLVGLEEMVVAAEGDNTEGWGEKCV